MIVVEDLHKTLRGVEVLRGASLIVEDGEAVALIGPSGEGKSVFLKHVAGLMTPDSGEVSVDGQELVGLSHKGLAKLRSVFGFVFQNGALFDSMTVYDNVAFPMREKSRRREEEIRGHVLKQIAQVGLAGSEEKFPAEISGGMVRRVALARALVRHPDIVLFDEPTTGLDPIIANSIHELIVAMHKELEFSAIIISHEIPAVFEIVDRVAMLHGGRIRFMGTPDEIMVADDPVVREFIQGSLPPVRFREVICERLMPSRKS